MTIDLASVLPATLTNGHSKPSPTSTSSTSAAALIPSENDTQLKVVQQLLTDAGNLDSTLSLSGYALTLGEVVRTARTTEGKVEVSPDVADRVNASVEFLQSKLGTSLYGINTGFGGSADTRTGDPSGLQKALLEHQHAGVLSRGKWGQELENALPLEVVRGAMLIRINSLTRGHSAVRLIVLDALVKFLNLGITPIVPLRGSISASGDLSPLSYIAGAITGHPNISVHVIHDGQNKILPTREAMALFGIEPVVLGPKEGLGLINGTAVSASFAALALHDAQFLALLSQALTALTVEALVGAQGSFHPFLHDTTRPHPQQIEVARNIRTMLAGSKFASEHEEEVSVEEDEGTLRQDRYPLRTSPQWLGPLVSDFIASHAVLSVELNSTTDNPIVDVSASEFHHGGNFQAMAVTNTMEKTRLGLAQIGKLNFQQLTEMINCSMNNGLPSCLAGSDPSLNYHTKGLDIAAAAYTSELGHLANPVSTHVQSAEQGNQAVNSLALISARRTEEANHVLSLLLATHLYCVLQAIDLRALEFDFKAAFDPILADSLTSSFASFLPNKSTEALFRKVKKALDKRYGETGQLDLVERWKDAFSFATGVVVEALATSSSASSTAGNPLAAVHAWSVSTAEAAVRLTLQQREAFWSSHNSPSSSSSSPAPALKYLGNGTKPLYEFVRNEVGVKARRGDVFLGRSEDTIGNGVAKIFEAIRDGRINRVLVEAMA